MGALLGGATLKGNKPDFVKGLHALISKQPNVLNLGTLPAIATTEAPVTPLLALTAAKTEAAAPLQPITAEAV